MKTELIKVRALVNETGLDDIGASGLTFPETQLIEGKIYEQADTTYWVESAKRKLPFFVDDNGCSRDIGDMVRKGKVEIIKHTTMKKTGNSNQEGLCTIKNPYPYKAHNPEHEVWYAFDRANPSLLLYDSAGNLICNAVDVEVEEVWQYQNVLGNWIDSPSVRYDEFTNFNSYNNDSKAWKVDTRHFYLLLSVSERENLDGHSEPNTCIVYGEDRSKKNFCDDCGLNADDYGSDKPVFGQMDVMKNIISNKQSTEESHASNGIKSESIHMEIVRQIRTQVEDNNDYVSDFFVDVYERLGKGIHAVEVRDYHNSNDRLSILKINDKTVASVIETRTEFNHVEFIFSENAQFAKREDYERAKHVYKVVDSVTPRIREDNK